MNKFKKMALVMEFVLAFSVITLSWLGLVFSMLGLGAISSGPSLEDFLLQLFILIWVAPGGIGLWGAAELLMRVTAAEPLSYRPAGNWKIYTGLITNLILVAIMSVAFLPSLLQTEAEQRLLGMYDESFYFALILSSFVAPILCTFHFLYLIKTKNKQRLTLTDPLHRDTH